MFLNLTGKNGKPVALAISGIESIVATADRNYSPPRPYTIITCGSGDKHDVCETLTNVEQKILEQSEKTDSQAKNG